MANIGFTANDESKVEYSNDEFSSIQGISLGSREYNQANSWLRYGTATYIYGQTTDFEDQTRKLKQYGGYLGVLA